MCIRDRLSLKPIIYAANMDEDGFAHYEDNKYFPSVRDLAARAGAQVLPICAKLEQDLSLIHILCLYSGYCGERPVPSWKD